MIDLLKDRLRRNITNAVSLRNGASYKRSLDGDPQLGITVCHGPGRCQIIDSADGVSCPFCVRLPDGPVDVEVVVRRMTLGN